ncbi:MAG: hypothetical protein ACRDTH_00185 [Pseudonocardiaceae bacterium]
MEFPLLRIETFQSDLYSGLILIVASSWRDVVAFIRRRLRDRRSPTE